MQKVYLVLFLFFISTIANAQSDGKGAGLRLDNAIVGLQFNESASFTGQSGTGANIDVIYHNIFWRLNPDSGSVTAPTKYIRGFVQTNFKTIAANVTAITFDLRSTLTIDSITFRSSKWTVATVPPASGFSRSGNIVTLTLGTTIATIGSIDSFTVFYRGTPPAVSGAAEGFQRSKSPMRPGTTLADTGNYIYTLSESYEDRDWWPCKADMQDKIDSMDITVSVPWTGADTFWVATNGKMIDSSIVGNSRIFKFKNTYPMASYLVSVAVGRYNRYYRSITLPSGFVLNGTFNIFRGKPDYTAITNAMAIQDSVVYKFSQKFGDYPFKNDKYGFYEGLGGAGGMEHQSFYAMATNSLTSQQTLSHELMHQWFGDKVTFATWADIWLAEGFARYGEALAGELHPATGINPNAEMATAKSDARSITTTPTRITSFTTSAQVWTGANINAMYDRGCMVVSMLRALSGDANFFQACRNYLDEANGAGYKSATTDSLKNNFERVLNYDLDPFFDDWVIKTGHPTTAVNWNNPSPNVLAVSVNNQTKSVSSSVVGRFHNVIILRVQGALANEDTTIVIYDIDGNNLAKAGNGIGASVSGNLLYYVLSFDPVTVTFDPFSRTMSNGSTSKLSTLDLNIVDFVVKNNGLVNDAVFTLDNNSINSEIVLERSANGISFSPLGVMSFNSNSSQNNKQYYYRDERPISGNNYYRVKFKHVDGSYKYSKIIKIISSISTSNKYVEVLSNPVKDVLQLKILQTGLQNESTMISIFDANGKLVKKINSALNTQIIILNVKYLSKGNYAAKIENEKGQLLQSIKFVIL